MNRGATTLGLVLLGLALLVVGLPLLSVLRAAVVTPQGEPTLGYLAAFLTEPVPRATLVRTLWVSAAGAVGAALLGATLAALTARVVLPGARGLRALGTLALLAPPFVGCYAWILLLGNNGVLRNALGLPTIYGPWGVAFVHALEHFPFVWLLVEAALRGVDRSLEEAAASLGASPWRIWTTITLPLVLPALSAGALLAFVLGLASFAPPMLLAPDSPTLATLAYRQFLSEVATDPGPAAAASVVLVLLAGAVLAAQRAVAGRRRVGSALLRRVAPVRLAGGRALTAAAAAWGIVLLATVPLGVVVASSFRATRGPVFQPGLSLDSYRGVLRSGVRAATNSLVYSGVATIVIVAVGLLAAWLLVRRRGWVTTSLDAMLAAPLVVPGTALGVALFLTVGVPPLSLAGTGAILVLAYVVRRLPNMVRAAAAALEQLDPTLEEAARSLGASPARALVEVTVPLAAPGLTAGAALAFVTCMNELPASIVLFGGGTLTLPVQIFQATSEGSLGPASALSTILLLLTAAVLWVVDDARAVEGAPS